MKIRPRSLFALLLSAGSALASDWTYSGNYITTSDGWKIQVNRSGTTLSTIDNGGMVKAAPATPDRPDGTYTLDLSGPITDAADPTKTYTLTTIGYYAFNGGVNIGTLILPESVTTWRLASAVGVFGRQGAKVDTVLPKDFSLGITWSGSPFGFDAVAYQDELHLNGVTETANVGLRFTHGGIQRIFFYPQFTTLHSTSFANSGSTRYDLYFRGDVPNGIQDGSFGTGNRGLLHVPGDNASWATWLAANAREFTASDVAGFEAKFPGFDPPRFVVTSGKFNGGYATFWNAAPGITVTSASTIGADAISPTYGTYTHYKTGTSVAFSAPEAVEQDGVRYVCDGYTLETAGASWDDATTQSFPGIRSFSLEADTGKAYRISWIWRPEVSASVIVSSNKGNAFGAPIPDYGTYTSFPEDTATFRAPDPGYEPETGSRYVVTGYRVTPENGSAVEYPGQQFSYSTDMGQITLEWLWSVNGYKLTTEAPGYLGVTTAPLLDAQGYGDIGPITLTASTSADTPFYHWSGHTAGIDSYAQTVQVSLTGPLTLVATPKCTWHFTGNSLTNALGWRVLATGDDNGLTLGLDCPKVGAVVPWNLDNETHLLDLSLPIVSDLTGNAVSITQSHNVPFRRAPGAPALAKLVLPDTYKSLSFDSEIFGGQTFLAEILPAPLPDDLVSTFGSSVFFGAIPYAGDIFLRSPAISSIGNVGVQFKHGKTQNITIGSQPFTLFDTSFTWSEANYRLWFEGFPTLASGRNESGNFSFYVQVPRQNSEWEAYLAEHTRPFAEADRPAFEARFPDDAASNNWPKRTFTSGYFNGTWARYYGRVETLILFR